jgi:hypothetical protein
MLTTLHHTITAYINASNARNTEALIGCFHADGIVTDEGHTYCGIDEIRQWLAKTQAAFDFTIRALDATDREGETIVTCQVTGSFPGSPVQLRHFFSLDGDKIKSLTIRV